MGSSSWQVDTVSMTTSQVIPSLPTTTIVPENESLFISYWSDLYSEMAETINRKDEIFYPMAITSVAKPILNLPAFGSFLLMVSATAVGSDGSWPPSLIVALCQSSPNDPPTAAAVLSSQAGQADSGAIWAGATLTVGVSGNHYTILHSVSGVSGNFNLRIVGTQTVG